MKRSILAGVSGFIFHAAWIVVGIALVSKWSFLNIYIFHARNIDKKPLLVSATYALLFSVLFGLMLYFANPREKRKKGIIVGASIGFYLAFWGLVWVLWAMFSGAQIG